MALVIDADISLITNLTAIQTRLYRLAAYPRITSCLFGCVHEWEATDSLTRILLLDHTSKVLHRYFLFSPMYSNVFYNCT